MLPSQTPHNPRDLHRVDAKSDGEASSRLAGSRPLADLADLGLGQLGMVTGLSLGLPLWMQTPATILAASMSSFVHAVLAVLGIRPQLHVTRTYTGGIVADPVQHLQPFGDRAMGECPGNSVSNGLSDRSPRIGEGTIAPGKLPCRPDPALTGLVYLLPEAFSQWALFALAVVKGTAVLAIALRRTGGRHFKEQTAVLANALDAAIGRRPLRPHSIHHLRWGITIATATGSVIGILLNGARDQVARIAAPRSIAGVSQQQAGWNRAVGTLIGYLMRLESGRVTSAAAEVAVAVAVSRGEPQPAIVRSRDGDLFPKAVGQRPLCLLFHT